LRQQGFKKVLLVVQEENAKPAARPGAAEIEALRQEIADCSPAITAEMVAAGAADIPTASLTAPTKPAAWRDLLRLEQADAAISVVWKSGTAGIAVRVTLLNDRKVVWTGRTKLDRSTPAGATTFGNSLGAGLAGLSQSSALSGGMGGAALGTAGGAFAGSLSATPSFTGSAQGPSAPTAAGTNGGAGTNAAGNSSPPATGLNAKILEFGRSNLGKKVGNGECYELATAAIAAAGGQPSRGNDFGEETALSELLPGDILQFYNVHLRSAQHGVWTLGDPGHTAIVSRVNGLVVSVYHQNINGQKIVREDTLDLGSKVSGDIYGYRAVARER
jgi:hypothetical protein